MNDRDDPLRREVDSMKRLRDALGQSLGDALRGTHTDQQLRDLIENGLSGKLAKAMRSPLEELKRPEPPVLPPRPESFKHIENMEFAMSAADQHALTAASVALAHLEGLVRQFEAELQPDEKLWLVLTGGAAGSVIAVQFIFALDPDKLIFVGLDREGHRVRAIQHVSQLNVLFKAVKDDGEPRQEIGFQRLNPQSAPDE